MPTPLFKKLNLGEARTILILNAPVEFNAELEKLNEVKVLRRATAKTTVDFGLGFAIDAKQRDGLSQKLADATQGDAVVWLAYPKKSSKRYRCDFNRDSGWRVFGAAGFEPVRQVSIDEDWSALRFRRTDFIKNLSRSKDFAISVEGKRRAHER